MKLIEKLKTISNEYPEIDYSVLKNIKNLPNVSFVIPSHNSARTISILLDSISGQNRIDLVEEVIIVDDCSTDNTEELISDVKNKYSFEIRYFRTTEKIYAAAARNIGIKEAKGELICFIDSDIVLPPDYLQLHAGTHSLVGNCITLSFRQDYDINHYQHYLPEFPIKNFTSDFRFFRTIIDKDKNNSNFDFYLYNETRGFKDLGSGNRLYWALPEVCLTCAITYRRADLLKVKGAPENFKGWGFNDTSMAAKVISLNRFVIPIIDAGVIHIKHPPRSGKKKYIEFNENKKRYKEMLNMEVEKTYEFFIERIN